ncbi:MAG: 50S ribosomal protein L11 methyltransferase [Ignavibacteria bacterium]|nr:50S ribosomal protein L11 methyltransferase [Ignavibacteria bacterium]
MKNYFEVIIDTDPFNPEELSGLLWELNPLGIVENDDALVISFDADESIDQTVKDFLQELVEKKVINSFSYSINEIEEKNWNEEWEKNLKVIKVTDKIVIKPSFREYSPSEGEIVITIDPKMSFGTGEHQTTKLMLSMCEKHIEKKTKVLDVGTGTGVLAIASVMLGADYALGIDNDEWCYENALENIDQNHVYGKVEFRLAEVGNISEHDFDCLLANIQKDVLLIIAKDIVSKVKAGGKVILSGLLYTDEADICDCYTQLGLSLSDKMQLDEWIALVFKK